jgi:hypothetical protein
MELKKNDVIYDDKYTLYDNIYKEHISWQWRTDISPHL